VFFSSSVKRGFPLFFELNLARHSAYYCYCLSSVLCDTIALSTSPPLFIITPSCHPPLPSHTCDLSSPHCSWYSWNLSAPLGNLSKKKPTRIQCCYFTLWAHIFPYLECIHLASQTVHILQLCSSFHFRPPLKLRPPLIVPPSLTHRFPLGLWLVLLETHSLVTSLAL